ncbi:MAG: hypothetical protein ACK5AZ_07960 [Bryobacteraceae bacterium]
MSESLELLFRIRTEGQQQLDAVVNSIKGVSGEVRSGSGALAQFDAANRKAAAGMREFGEAAKVHGESFTAAVLKANLLTEAITKAAGAIKEYTVGAAQYAARTETLGVVMDQLAKVNNLSTGAVRAQAEEVKKLGITTQEAMGTINKMIFAQLDLKKSTDLARLAQNAAVIAGINSSEALAGIIHGIVTRQPEVLRTYGIIVDFEKAYQKAARERGRELAAVEKQEIALQEVLKQGTKITGAYEASMLTAGKQLTSLKRYTDEAKQSIGEGLVPALGNAILFMTRLSKYAEENGEHFSKMAVGVTAVGAAFMAFRAMPGPWQLKAGAGAVAGIGTWLMGQPDPIAYYQEQGETAISNLMRQREEINRRLQGAKNKLEAESLKTQFEANKEAVQSVVNVLADSLAKIYVERGKGVMFEAERIAQGMDLGHGVKVGRGDVLLAIRNRKHPDMSGSTFNQEAYDKAVQDELSEEARKRVKAREEQLKKLIDSLDERALDPLAKLILDTEQRLRDAVGKYGPLTPGEQARVTQSLRGAILRETAKRKPQPEAVDLSKTGFQYGWLPTIAQSVEVDQKVNEKMIADFRERSLRAIQRYTSFQERMIQLTAGPGGELEAIERIATLREQSALREFQITQDRGKLESDLDRARKDRLISIAQFQKQQLDNYREQAGRVFDALTASGGGGLVDFIKGQVKILERQIFVNASAGIFQKVGSTLGGIIPGQTGADGKPTILGTLLSGTIFDSKNRTLETVTKDNTVETKKNTAAMVAMTYAMQSALSPGSGGGALMAGGIPDISSLPGGDYLGKWMTIFNPLGGGVPGGTNAAKAPSTMSQFFSGLLGGTLSGNPLGVIFTPSGESVQLGPGRAGSFSTAERIGTAIGTASVIAGGAYGVYSGIKRGGARGATTAISSAAGTAAALAPEPISKAVLMGVSLVSGLIGGLLGDPRKEYDEAVTNALKRNKKDWPADVDRTTDLYGNDVDYDYRGRTRVTRTTVINMRVDAMDAKSILERSPEIGLAVAKEIGMGNGQLIQTVQRAAFS